VAGGVQDDGAAISGINVTPLVDIMLVLLIIFMVTARLDESTAVALDLPEAETTATVERPFEIAVPVDGEPHFDGTRFDDTAALAGAVAQAWRADERRPVVIAADGDVAHRRVLALLGALQNAGVRRIAFAAEPEVGASP